MTALHTICDYNVIFLIIFFKTKHEIYFSILSTLNVSDSIDSEGIPFSTVHYPECEIDSFFFTRRVLGETVQPVLLASALHQQQRSGEQGETDEVRSALGNA